MKTLLVALLSIAAGTASVRADLFRPSVVHGAAIGAVAGAVIGHNNGRHAGEGAAIGAVAGAIVGAIADDHRPRGRVVVTHAPAYCPPAPVVIVQRPPSRVVYVDSCPPPAPRWVSQPRVVVVNPCPPAPVVYVHDRGYRQDRVYVQDRRGDHGRRHDNERRYDRRGHDERREYVVADRR